MTRRGRWKSQVDGQPQRETCPRTFPRFPPRLEIAPKTKARDFHIPTATGPSLSLQVRLRAALATDPRGCVAKRHHRTQKKGGPAKKYLTGIAVFRDALPGY